MVLFRNIPGETPIEDFSCLRVKGITLCRELSEVEGENIRKVLKKYFVRRPSRKKAPFDYSWVLKLHREMFGDVWTWAGTPRKHDLNLGVPYQEVETKLYDLLARLPYWKDESWETQAAMLHHQAVQIHPFPNGNGRWSRMLANIWLWLNGQNVTNWPEALIGEESPIRMEYLAAIRAADEGDYQQLIALHEQFTPPI